MTTILKLPAALIRGGTSKGLFFEEHDLPLPGEKRDALLLDIMGSPDSTGMQLNGMGGGISSTSKVALISKSKRPNVDIDYLFGQVSLKEPSIDWRGSCGNLAAAAGLYAISKGYVKPANDVSAKIKIWQANLGHEIHLEMLSPTLESNLITIPGVPGKSAGIYVDFISPGESLLPDGKPIHDLILSDGRTITATLILGANPTIFINPAELALSGKELPKEIDFKKIEHLIKAIGIAGAAIMKIPYTSAIRVSWIAEAEEYTTADEIFIQKNSMDILGRISTEGRVHHAYTGTGAINLACAAKIPDSIPFNIIKAKQQSNNAPLKIGHPAGVMQVNAEVAFDYTKNNWIALRSGFMRTAKILMIGDVYA